MLRIGRRQRSGRSRDTATRLRPGGNAWLAAMGGVVMGTLMLAAVSDLSPMLGLVVVIAAGAASTMLAFPFLAYLGVVASTPMGFPLGGMLTLTKVTGALGVLSYLVNLLLRRAHGFSLRVSPVVPLTLAFLGWSVVSIGYALDSRLAWNEFRASLHGYAAFFLTVALVRDQSRLYIVAWTLTLVGIGEALLGLAEYALGFKLPGAFIETGYTTALEPRSDLDEIRPAGTTGHPLFLAPLLQLATGLAIWLVADQPVRWRLGLLWPGIALMVVVWVLAESRASMVAVIVVGSIYGWRYLWRRSLWILAGTIVVLVTVLAVSNLPSDALGGLMRKQHVSRTMNAFDFHSPFYLNLDDPSVRLRVSHIVTGWRLVAEFPWTGVGVGNWPVAHEIFLPNWAYPTSTITAHNAFAQVAAELGVIGLLLFLGMLGATFADLRRVRRDTAGRAAERSLHRFAQILGIVLVAHVVAHLGFERGRLVFLLLALAPALRQIVGIERESVAPTSGPTGGRQIEIRQ